MNKEKSHSPVDAERLGLRERKAAATRLALTRALSDRLAHKSLADITVDELAEAAGVSRVTFFNYFATKELALEQVLMVWFYERQCEAEAKKRRGVAAIEALFRAMGGFVQQAPQRARQALAWMVASAVDRPIPALSLAERVLLAGEGAEAPELRSLGESLLVYVAEARADGEIHTESTDYELAHMLGALLIGGCLVGHSKPKQNWEKLYLHHVRRVLGADAAPAPKSRARDKRSAS